MISCLLKALFKEKSCFNLSIFKDRTDKILLISVTSLGLDLMCLTRSKVSKSKTYHRKLQTKTHCH